MRQGMSHEIMCDMTHSYVDFKSCQIDVNLKKKK